MASSGGYMDGRPYSELIARSNSQPDTSDFMNFEMNLKVPSNIPDIGLVMGFQYWGANGAGIIVVDPILAANADTVIRQFLSDIQQNQAAAPWNIGAGEYSLGWAEYAYITETISGGGHTPGDYVTRIVCVNVLPTRYMVGGESDAADTFRSAQWTYGGAGSNLVTAGRIIPALPRTDALISARYFPNHIRTWGKKDYWSGSYSI